MMKRTLIAACAWPSASLVGPGFAQEQKTINGIAVPATELEAVQMKCDELLSNSATGMAKTLPAPPTLRPRQPSCPRPERAPMPRRPSPRRKPRSIRRQSTVAAAGSGRRRQHGRRQLLPMRPTTIDLATLTAEICTEGGFTATTP